MPMRKVGQRIARTGSYCTGDGRARLKQNDVQLFAPRCSLTDVTNSQPSRPTRLSSAVTFCWSSNTQTEPVIQVCSQRVGFVPARTGEMMILGATAATAHPATIPAKINTTLFGLVFMPAMLTRLQVPGVQTTGAGVQSQLQSHVTVWQPSGESLADTPSLHRTRADCIRTHYPNGGARGH